MIQTDSALYRVLVVGAMATAALIIAAMVYQYVFIGDVPGELNYRLGNLRLEDGKYQEALAEFDIQLQVAPLSTKGQLGRGLALMGLGEFNAALQAINYAIDLKPDFAAAYANRGILHDKMSRHEQALQDYRKALKLDEETGEGPDWLTRFFRNQYDAPPTIVDRAAYLEQELKKPVSQRLLQIPEIDKEQRSYKFEKKL
ncbi:MAG: tetratricopeptide repeat protein [SAR324 cluster bacterium]|nr:tetratricopeptide repeat protein [SAR324 cluster bacterium]